MESVNTALCVDDVAVAVAVAALATAALNCVGVGFVVIVAEVVDALAIETGFVIVVVAVAVDGLTTAVIEGFR